MRNPFLLAEADECRRHAADLHGEPEAPLLLRIAGYFEELATQSNDEFEEPLVHQT